MYIQSMAKIIHRSNSQNLLIIVSQTLVEMASAILSDLHTAVFVLLGGLD